MAGTTKKDNPAEGLIAPPLLTSISFVFFLHLLRERSYRWHESLRRLRTKAPCVVLLMLTTAWISPLADSLRPRPTNRSCKGFSDRMTFLQSRVPKQCLLLQMMRSYGG